MMRALVILLSLMLGLAGCGVVYKSPSVERMAGADGKLRVVDMTPETVLVANRSTYQPKTLPPVFFTTAGYGSGLRGAGPTPEPAFDRRPQEDFLETRLPPEVNPGPYRIGTGDVLLLATPQTGSTVEQLSGLLAATNARQGYTVQDDGAIAIPNVGRVQIAGLTLEEAEAALFQRLVENQIDPTFSLEIAEFNSKKVSIGGAVSQPTVAPISLTALYLDEALAAAGGITVEDQDYASVRIYRDGTLYQIPLTQLYAQDGLRRIQLIDGDSVFVDTSYELDLAQAYFEEQIRLAQFKQSSRSIALSTLNTEIGIRRDNQQDERKNYLDRLNLDSVDRDYVYLTGEVDRQSRYELPFGRTAVLAEALYGSGGVPVKTGDASEIYVLRGSSDPREFGATTAWRLNTTNAGNILLATRFELRPNDVIFVAEQPVTKWNRVIQQITPSLVTTAANTAARASN